jgi:tRNA pseudouridine32 synthase/23S rRNA pseudouridine746 synthase
MIIPNVPILISDSAILVVNKPAGLPTLPDGYDPLAPHLKSVLEPVYGKLWIVHRLDRDTSGVIVLARNTQAHCSLNEQFSRHQVHKIYHALLVGEVDWAVKTVRLPLRVDVGHRHRTVVDPQRGKPAITHLKVLERLRCTPSNPTSKQSDKAIAFTLVEAIPETGRTHQIRAHLYALGFFIAADPLYGDGNPIFLSQLRPNLPVSTQRETPLLRRLGLHAKSLAFNHPVSGEALVVEAPYPQDIEDTLLHLRTNSP